MATFKVGQRVRLVHVDPGGFQELLGREATIDAIPSRSGRGDCSIAIDGEWGTFSARWDNLAPLTDPKADEFIERIKRMEREPGTIKDPAPEWDVA